MPLSKLYFINLGPHGTFRPSGLVQTLPQDVDAIFAHLETNRAQKIVVHFHGGLVGESTGMAIAEKMQPLYLGAGSHPITFVWETGFLETVSRSLSLIYKTDLFQEILKYVLKYAAKKLGGGIAGKGPGQEMSDDEIRLELAKEDRFDRFDDGARGGASAIALEALPLVESEIEAEIEEDLEANRPGIEQILKEEVPAADLLNRKIAADISTAEGKGIVSLATLAKFLARVTIRVIARFVRKRDHGLYPTVMEEILREFYIADVGSWVWGGMKDTAEKMWRPNTGLSGEEMRAGTYFLDLLAAYQTKHPECKIDIVGHSAGAIVICQLLAVAAQRHPNLRWRNVLLLAPACTAELFHNEIVANPKRFGCLRVFTMSDTYECRDHLVKLIYTRSLLYFISGVLEDQADKPLAGLERHISGKKPYDDAFLLSLNKFLYADGTNRGVFSITAGGALAGLQTSAEKHGDFDDNELTRQSLKHIISQ
jgi:hypothetical protein